MGTPWKLFKNIIRDDHELHDWLPPKRRLVLRGCQHEFNKLEPNAWSIISCIDASCIKLTAYKELHNVT